MSWVKGKVLSFLRLVQDQAPSLRNRNRFHETFLQIFEENTEVTDELLLRFVLSSPTRELI